MNERRGKLTRKTSESDIAVEVNLDGSGKYDINTGIGFFDHMLNQLSRHSFMDLKVLSIGDIEVDCHHTIEDTGIVLGKCINAALGDKSGIRRYGTSYVPMDESLAFVSMDLSGRPYLVFDCSFESEKVGSMDTEMVEEFFRALCVNAGITLHMKVLYGKNTHHKIEALFKAFGRALTEAASFDSRITGIMSTKGSLET